MAFDTPAISNVTAAQASVSSYLDVGHGFVRLNIVFDQEGGDKSRLNLYFDPPQAEYAHRLAAAINEAGAEAAPAALHLAKAA